MQFEDSCHLRAGTCNFAVSDSAVCSPAVTLCAMHMDQVWENSVSSSDSLLLSQHGACYMECNQH